MTVDSAMDKIKLMLKDLSAADIRLINTWVTSVYAQGIKEGIQVYREAMRDVQE